MIGNQEDAELIAYYFAMALDYDSTAPISTAYGPYARHEHFEKEDNTVGQVLPGWEILGQGMYRVAYLSPDGVVYKVQWRMTAVGNRAEHEFMREYFYTKKWAIKTALYDFHHPTAHYVDVIACEYVPGEFPGNIWELPNDDFNRIHDTYADVDGIIVHGKALALLKDLMAHANDVHNENIKVTPDGGLKLLDAGS